MYTFENLPLIAKKFIFHIASMKVKRDRFFGNYNKYLTRFNEEGQFKEVKLDETLKTKEAKLIYKELHDSIDDYPIIDKAWLKNRLKEVDYYNKITSDGYMSTSGSTGSALKIPYDLDFLRFKFAASWYFRSIHGLYRGVPNCNFTGRVMFDINTNKAPYWLWGQPNKQLLCSQYHMNSVTIKYYLDAFRRYRIEWLHGYPSVLSLFANIVIENNMTDEFNALNLKGITVSSESLSDLQKAAIEKAFGCSVFNYYGQAESVVDIFECEKGKLHINEKFSKVELIHLEGNKYKLIGTQLRNSKFPLIRYDTGDIVEYNKDDYCECGRHFRVVRKVLGRIEDVLILDDGRKIGRLDHIFKNCIEIVEAQIIQDEPGSALFKIVCGKDYDSEDEKILTKEIRAKLGKEFRFQINYVSSIERSVSGKFKQVISKL